MQMLPKGASDIGKENNFLQFAQICFFLFFSFISRRDDVHTLELKGTKICDSVRKNYNNDNNNNVSYL